MSKPNIQNDPNFVNNTSKNIHIQDQSLHKYFSQIPHIIYELGWSAHKISAYSTLKRTAGEHGQCTKSTTKLAKMSGMKDRHFREMVKELCEIDPILKKSPIIKITRLTDDGDRDTNLIIINDIWPENMNYFKDDKGGHAPYAGPHAQHAAPHAPYAGGVMHNMQEGHAPYADKEETIKNNPLKKTTTPTPSGAVADVHKTKISEQDKLSAKQLQDWCQKEAYKLRKKKQGRSYEDYERGAEWVIPLKDFENLIHTYGIGYFQEQLDLMYETQADYEKGKKKEGVLIPKTWLRAACKKNYAESTDKKMEKL